jgi:hypothetical protein
VICTLTARRVKPGAEDEFRSAFEGAVAEMPDEVNKRWTRVYICRDVAEENVVLTFGFFDGTLDELREVQERAGRDALVQHLAPHVDEVLLDGSFEVVEEITP